MAQFFLWIGDVHLKEHFQHLARRSILKIVSWGWQFNFEEEVVEIDVGRPARLNKKIF